VEREQGVRLELGEGVAVERENVAWPWPVCARAKASAPAVPRGSSSMTTRTFRPCT
jgi:hypothetical protein